MPIAPETVSLSGSGLVFSNSYGAGVTDAYRSAIITAENALQSHFSNAVTVSMNFDLQSGSTAFSAQNSYAVVPVSYGALVSALAAHATTADDFAAVAGLPAADPSMGAGFWVPGAEARVLGLATEGQPVDDSIVLNGALSFNFGPDVVGILEHEITEGVFGRVSSLGLAETAWEPMDLFRFDAAGHRDFTGGSDGVATFFGVDGAHVSTLQFHNSVNAAGQLDGFDLADWDRTVGDAFGPGGAGSAGTLSSVDLQALDILGWTPSSAGGVSQVTASSGSPSAAGGDSLAATSGATQVMGGPGNDTIAGAPVADYLRGGDGDDSISGGAAFDDINGNQGNDTAHGNAGDDWVVGGRGDDSLTGDAGADIVWGNLGNDTLDGGDGADQVRGGQGDDSLAGGAGNDFISGDRGNDTESGGAGADVFHTSQDAGIDKVLDFNYAEGDRVQLDPGTTYVLHQIGADTVIDTGNGNEMILVGVQLSTLPSDWIFGA
jgi:Ca2+-binding RTX toxin-like protein